MEEMEKYLSTIKNETHRKRLRQIFDWIMQNFPELEYKTMWNQPVFLEHNTFIIGFSAAKKHFSVSPEAKGIERFSNEIKEAGYTQSKNLFRIGWEDTVDFRLLEKIINFNRIDKAECSTFWRK